MTSCRVAGISRMRNETGMPSVNTHPYTCGVMRYQMTYGENTRVFAESPAMEKRKKHVTIF